MKTNDAIKIHNRTTCQLVRRGDPSFLVAGDWCDLDQCQVISC